MMTKQAELKKQAYASDLKSRALSVLIYLIDRSNKDLTCFPAIPTMAEQLHISVSTVKRALHELVQAGFIKKDSRFRDKNRGQTSNLYTLVPQENAPEPLESKVSDIEPKQEDKAECTVERLTFETLKAEQPEKETAVFPAGEMVDTPMESEEPQTKSEDAELPHRELQVNVQAQYAKNSICPAYKSKVRKLKHLSLQRRTLPILFQWTGVGFNLQPP